MPTGGQPGPVAQAHAFVADIAAPELTDADRHHLERALRLRVGDELTVSDGAGALRLCRLARSEGDAGAAVEPLGDPRWVERPSPSVTIGLALTKGERLEWAVQKLTELGVDTVVVMATHRSVVRWDGDRAATHLARLRRIAREASMQARRVWLPEVVGIETFAEAIRRPGAVLAAGGGGPPSLGRPVVLVGPEGGWAPDEVAAADAAGVGRAGLGPHVLRAETAAVVAGALLCALREGLVGPK